MAAVLAEAMLFCLPWLITAATGSCTLWVQSLALTFLWAALNNCSVSPPLLSKWEESVKDGKEGCLFELGSVHCFWTPNTLRHTHMQIHTLFPCDVPKSTSNCCFVFQTYCNLLQCFFQHAQLNWLFFLSCNKWWHGRVWFHGKLRLRSCGFSVWWSVVVQSWQM